MGADTAALMTGGIRGLSVAAAEHMVWVLLSKTGEMKLCCLRMSILRDCRRRGPRTDATHLSAS